MKTKRAKATDISMKVKRAVFERDKGMCVVCHNRINVLPNAHILSRAKGGLGVETNIVTLCGNFTLNKCHYKFDNGTREERKKIEEKITAYMKSIYGENWCKKDQKYKKGI